MAAGLITLLKPWEEDAYGRERRPPMEDANCPVALQWLSELKLKAEDGSLSTQCWNWQGCTDANGYGALNKGLKVRRAHRQAVEASSSDPHILHSCRSKACCRPSHLRFGTAYENALDKKSGYDG